VIRRALTAIVLALVAYVAATPSADGPTVEKLGDDLYAYISDNDASANATFLVGPDGIFVVDPGLNATEGEKLLREIRRISAQPVKYILNTHYHPDHQGANGVVGPDAVVISTPFTRQQTLRLILERKKHNEKNSGSSGVGTRRDLRFREATETVDGILTVYLGPHAVEIHAVGPAHTGGDAYAYFPDQGAVSAGDLFLTDSSPAMDRGSVENWIRALDSMLALPATRFVPGHFDAASRQKLQRFRDYLADLYAQVKQLVEAGATLEQVRNSVRMENYADFRQYPKYGATFADNAAAVYEQLRKK
jgi:glyoxylase-like metal-dependent hydrolase (beta-lactamase superfamily II)